MSELTELIYTLLQTMAYRIHQTTHQYYTSWYWDMQHLTDYHDYVDNCKQKTFQLLHIHYIDQLRADAIITVNGRNVTEMKRVQMTL